MKTLVLDIEKLRAEIEANPQEWACNTTLKMGIANFYFRNFDLPHEMNICGITLASIYVNITLCGKNPLDYFKEQAKTYTFDEAMDYIDEHFTSSKIRFEQLSNEGNQILFMAGEYIFVEQLNKRTSINAHKNITDFVLVEG